MSICVVDTSIERCENGEHIQDMDSVFPQVFAVKTNRWHYFGPILVERTTSMASEEVEVFGT